MIFDPLDFNCVYHRETALVNLISGHKGFFCCNLKVIMLFHIVEGSNLCKQVCVCV